MRDDIAFKELVEKHHAACWRSAWRILRDEARATDVVQVVYLELWEGEEEFPGTADAEAMLRWRATRRALNQLRGEARKIRREQEHAMQRESRGAEDPRKVAETKEMKARVDEATSELPVGLRQAIVLRFQEGMSFARMAEMLGCAEATAHERVRKGLERMRMRLGQAGIVLSVAALEDQVRACPVPDPPSDVADRLVRLMEQPVGAASIATASSGFWAWSAACVLIASVAVSGWMIESSGPTPLVPATTGQAAAEPGTGGLTDVGAAGLEDGPIETVAFRPPAPASGGSGVVDQPTEATVAASRIIGRVVDAEGAPIGDVPVSLRPYRPGLKSIEELHRVRTGRDGRFAFAEPQSGWPPAELELRVMPRYHGNPATRRIVAPKQSERDLGELVFERDSDAPEGAFALTVVLRDEQGAVVPGASVWLERLRGPQDRPQGWAFEADEVSDERGKVVLRGALLGTKRITVTPNWRSRLVGRRLQHVVQGAGEAMLTVEVPAGETISGRVIGMGDLASHEVQIALRPLPGGPVSSSWPREDGTWSIEGLSPVEHLIEVFVAGSPVRHLGPVTPPLEDHVIDLTAPSQTHLEPGLHGRFIHAVTGEGVPLTAGDLDLRAVPIMDSRTFSEDFAPSFLTRPLIAQKALINGQAIASSSFHVVRPAPGHHLIEVRYPGFAPAYAGPFQLDEGQRIDDIEIRLEPAARIRGVIVDPSGQPVTGAAVFPVGQGRFSERLLQERMDELPDEGASSRRLRMHGVAISGADGSFELENLPSSMSFRLAVIARAHPALIIDRPGLVPGKVSEVGRLVLKR